MPGDEEQRQRGGLGALDVHQDGGVDTDSVDTWSSASSAGGTEAADLRTLSTSSFGNIAVEGSSGVLIGGTTHLHQAITLVVPADTPPPPAVAVRDPHLPDLLPHAARGRQKHLPVDTQPDGSTACSRRPSCPASGLRSTGRRIRLAVCALAVVILCFLLSLYLILPNCYEWVPYPDDGALPGCALAGGRGVSGEALFIARAYINNKYRDYVPGKVVPSAGGAWAACFTWNGREDCRNSSFQVLCADSRLGEWVDCAGGNVTDHAVYSGGTSDSERLYVCRVRDRGAVTPGKLHPSKGGCYVALEGAEVRYPTYQVLDHCETLLCILERLFKRSNYGRCKNAPRKQHS